MRQILLLLFSLLFLTNSYSKNLDSEEIYKEFDSQSLRIKFKEKTYCLKVQNNKLEVLKNDGCNDISHVVLTKSGRLCIEDTNSNCKTVKKKSSKYTWGHNHRILLSNPEKLPSYSKGKAPGANLVKKAQKLYKQKKYYEAFNLAKEAAEMGNINAYYGMGLAYEQGKGVVDKNKKTAIEWYRKAAENGHIDGMLKVAHLIRFDDPDEAVKWLEIAAEKENAKAMNNLGYMWEMGHLSTFGKSDVAHQWYLKSAKLGNKTGQYNVCLHLYKGTGVQRNISEAKKWCKRSADQGFNKADELLRKINDSF